MKEMSSKPKCIIPYLAMALTFVASTLALLAVLEPASAAPSTKKLNKRDSIPDYALTYAPYTYLYSGEEWFCSDIAVHVEHMSMEADYVNVSTTVTLETVDEYSSDDYMTSYDNVEDNPAWLLSDYGIPDDSGYSAAPATIIAVDKDDVTDVFYFYFYSYNHGTEVLGTEVDNHIGDWEHSMIRFNTSTGEPLYIYMSAHTGGYAYTWDAIDKLDDRPIVYSATGTHANYATSGSHDIYWYLLNLVTDTTDAGYLWDVSQNYRGFWFDDSTDVFTSAGGAGTGATEQETEGVDWLYWLGHWGDEEYPTSDSRQDCILDVGFDIHKVFQCFTDDVFAGLGPLPLRERTHWSIRQEPWQKHCL